MTRRRVCFLLLVMGLYVMSATTVRGQARPGPMAAGPAEVPVRAARAHNVPPALPEALRGESGMAGFNAGGVRLGRGGASRPGQVSPSRSAPSSPPGHAPRAPGIVSAPLPEAADPTGLTVTKTWDGSAWQITLSWSGGLGLYTISYCADPTFQSGVVSLAKNSSATSITVQAGSPNLEFFVVTDGSVVSPAVQGMGYDPEPAPSVPTASGTGLWWGDSVTLTGSYLDPIPAANLTEMYDLPVRATSTTGGPPYATSALFQIPDDARGFSAFVQAHGRSCTTAGLSYVSLYPRGISPYTNIHGVAYVPQSGHVWVAADGIAQELDIFQHTPALVPGRSWSDLEKPYISRVTNTNIILLVDGVPGVTTVYKVDLSTGLRTPYASTADGGFTRGIWPVGIAADPDGSACYIADNELGLVVKIPAGNGSAIVDNWGNWTWNFPDPCGMDVNVGHQVIVASADETNGYAWDGYIPVSGGVTYLYGYTHGVAYSLQLDRDVSTASSLFVLYTNNNGIAEAFNQNAIGSNPAAYHAGMIYGAPDGHIALDPTGNYAIYHHWPQRVVVNNSGQNEAYPSSDQSQDRIIQMLIQGWGGRKVRLRAIDPPDLSPYAPYGGYPARHDTAVPPYEANDNFGTTDYGIATLPDGSDAAVSKILTFPNGSTDVTSLTFYLKVPARYSGDNFQVEATKCNYAGTVLPQRVMGLSAVYTSWKRAFVERDHMFRRGGLLYQSYGTPPNCGIGGYPDCCGQGGNLPCDQIRVYDWANVSPGDTIVVFDAAHPAENGGETRTIQVSDPGPDNTTILTLDTPLTNSYLASTVVGGVPTFETTPLPDNQGHSGGVGVLSNCDSDPNQINHLGSCYYDPDLRDIEQPFDDAYVEHFAPRAGMGAVPYIAASFFDSIANSLPIWRLGKIWFAHCGGGADWQCASNNYFHMIGVFSNVDTNPPWGYTNVSSNGTFVFTGTIESATGTTYHSHQWVADHEDVHEFFVNPCTCDGHDENFAWCDTWNHCGLGGTDNHRCLMNPFGPLFDRESGVNRMDAIDLLDGIGSSCTIVANSCGSGLPPVNVTYDPPAGSIRQDTDPQ